MVSGVPRVAATLGVTGGHVIPGVTSIGRKPATCLLLVFHLVPVGDLKILVNTPCFLSASSSLT